MIRNVLSVGPSVLILIGMFLVGARRGSVLPAPLRLRRLEQTGSAGCLVHGEQPAKAAARPNPQPDTGPSDQPQLTPIPPKAHPGEAPRAAEKTASQTRGPAADGGSTDLNTQRSGVRESSSSSSSSKKQEAFARQPLLTAARSVSATPPVGRSRWPVDPIQWKSSIKLKPDEEAKLGKALHEIIRHHHQVLAEEAAPEFLNHLYKLSARLRAADVETKIYLIDSNESLSFSHIGGYIYLSRRLAQTISEDVELEFILAHEMAHLEKHHGIAQVVREMVTKTIPSDQPGLVQRLYHQIAAGYDPRMEYEADASACHRLVRLKRSAHGICLFLRRLENYEFRRRRAAAAEGGDRRGRGGPERREALAQPPEHSATPCAPSGNGGQSRAATITLTRALLEMRAANHAARLASIPPRASAAEPEPIRSCLAGKKGSAMSIGRSFGSLSDLRSVGFASPSTTSSASNAQRDGMAPAAHRKTAGSSSESGQIHPPGAIIGRKVRNNVPTAAGRDRAKAITTSPSDSPTAEVKTSTPNIESQSPIRPVAQ